jgi:hypothetical protein
MLKPRDLSKREVGCIVRRVIQGMWAFGIWNSNPIEFNDPESATFVLFDIDLRHFAFEVSEKSPVIPDWKQGDPAPECMIDIYELDGPIDEIGSDSDIYKRVVKGRGTYSVQEMLVVLEELQQGRDIDAVSIPLAKVYIQERE